MRPFAAVAILCSLAVPLLAETPLESQHKTAAEQLQGRAAGKGVAAAASLPVAGSYGTKAPPAAAKTARKPAPMAAPPEPKAAGEKRPTTGEVVGGFLMLLIAAPLVLTTGAKLLEEEMKTQPFKDQPKK